MTLTQSEESQLRGLNHAFNLPVDVLLRARQIAEGIVEYSAGQMEKDVRGIE